MAARHAETPATATPAVARVVLYGAADAARGGDSLMSAALRLAVVRARSGAGPRGLSGFPAVPAPRIPASHLVQPPAACTGTASRRDVGLGDRVDLNLPVFAYFCKHCSRHCALQRPLLHGSTTQPACPSRPLTGFVTGVRGGVKIEACPSRAETGVGSRPGPFRALLTCRTAGQSCG